MSILPFSSSAWSVPVTPELRRAAEYREGRKLSDREILNLLQQELHALVSRWSELGRWLDHLDRWHPAVRPKLSQIAVNNPSQEERDRRSAAMKRVWAAKRARGERLPSPKRASSREFGQRAAWRTPEQKAHQSDRQRAAWAQRKAVAKEA